VTIVAVKQQLQAVMQLPDGPPALYTVEAYEVLQPVHAAIGRVLTEIRRGCSEEVLEELDRLSRLKSSKSKQKCAGTGSADTPEETWEAMRAASLAGETLRSLSKRFGVIHSAVIRRRSIDRWVRDRPWGTREREQTNVIQFPRRTQP